MSRAPVRWAAALAMVCLLAAAGAHAAATFIIENQDSAGEGFNDPTPWTPTGGNPATTLGQARLNAFQRAANLWGGLLRSSVPIRVRASMDALTCTAESAVLGQAGATTIHQDFSNAPLADTWYSQALANALAGLDVNTFQPDINATFNSSINGSAGCLGGASWYYGYDGNPPSGYVDFIAVVMHEIGHGLGFQTYVDPATGAKAGGYNDTFMLNIERALAVPSTYPAMSNAQRIAAAISDPALRWTGANATYMASQVPVTVGLNGGYARLHAPNPLQLGSSVSHWSIDVAPNEMMEPVLTGANHDPGLAIFLMMDIGWPTDASVGVVFRDLRAEVQDGTVAVTWGYEADEPILGFRVYRARDGKTGTEQLTNELDLGAGARRFVDTAPPAGSALLYSVAAVRPDGSETRSAAVAVSVAAVRLVLAQNRPNPFNPSTEVDFVLDRDAAVSLRVYDLAGRLVRTLVDEPRPAGPHTAFWDGRSDAGRSVASGTYVYRLDAGSSVLMKRMTLLK